jgi:hypothetical protein
MPVLATRCQQATYVRVLDIIAMMPDAGCFLSLDDRSKEITTFKKFTYVTFLCSLSPPSTRTGPLARTDLTPPTMKSITDLFMYGYCRTQVV